MHAERPTLVTSRLWVWFVLPILPVMGIYALYGLNIVWWRNSPDFGWRTMNSTGPNFVAEVMDSGEQAGLRVGDMVVAINGKPYWTFDDLFFGVRRQEPGSLNAYTVLRDGQRLEINIVTQPLGLKAALARSGPIFAVGLVYTLIGVLVFLMKPQAGESWLFLVMACFFGLEISLGAPSFLMAPLWLYDVRLLIEAALPAPLIHLALRFPKTRTFYRKRPWIWTIPYIIPTALFVAYKMTSTSYWDSPPVLDLANLLYLVVGVLIFIASMVWNSLRDSSLVIRLQSQAICVGIILGFFVPTIELLARSLWRVYLFPSPALAFALFLSVFPLSIGYTIVKHDLFAIDVIVRRTYGYMLSTATIIAAYSLVVLILNVTFQFSDMYRSPVFSVLFALGVVFFFKPLHERFQNLVDRVFYRQHYDYRKTIKDISEAMIRILDPGEIHRRLIGSLVREMFLENGLLLLPDPDKRVYLPEVVEGGEGSDLGSVPLAEDDVLPRLLKEKKDAIFRYEADLNPAYEVHRDALSRTFCSFQSELMLPLTYQDEVRGIISLGGKKSGKMFTLEDLDLLKTITNQSSIALENAKLFEENIEKSRMEEELKIAHDLQTSMLPEEAPTVHGFTIAAKSIPAREVGGDFYDFIPIGGNGSCEKLAIIVGDVSGKAVSGALVMAASRSIFRVLSEASASVKDIMITGNARLINDVKKGMFVALLYAVLDSKHRTLTLSNAGQTQPIMCSDDDSEPFHLETEGDTFPLGILKDCEYEETRIPLKRGDTIVFYTDGIVEAMNAASELYGFERLLSSISDARNLAAHSLVEHIIADVEQFVRGLEQHDDLTVVVVKVE